MLGLATLHYIGASLETCIQKSVCTKSAARLFLQRTKRKKVSLVSVSVSSQLTRSKGDRYSTSFNFTSKKKKKKLTIETAISNNQEVSVHIINYVSVFQRIHSFRILKLYLFMLKQ